MISFAAATGLLLLTAPPPPDAGVEAGAPINVDGGVREPVSDADIIDSLDLLLDLPQLEKLELLEALSDVAAESP